MVRIKKYGKLLLGVATIAAGAGMAQYAQAQKASKLQNQHAQKLEAITTGKATMRYWVNDQATGKYLRLQSSYSGKWCATTPRFR